jgi:diguanylate cyclase (GGDEF)-like protein
LLRRLFPALSLTTMFLALSSISGQQIPLTTVAQIRQLSPQQAEQGRSVSITGVVTYADIIGHSLFVDDGTGSIFVYDPPPMSIRQGDLIQVTGATTENYLADIVHSRIKIVGHQPLPTPKPATFTQLISGASDCGYVTLSGVIRSATMQPANGEPFLMLEMLADGGYVNLHIEHPTGLNPNSLLDARVEATGVSGGLFDGKFQLKGARLYLDSGKDLRILSPPSAAPQSLPLTPMDHILSAYDIEEKSHRVRVRGSVTLYEPGERLVIEDHGLAMLVHTLQNDPLNLGDVVDVVGFPDVNDYSPSLDHAQFLRTADRNPILPTLISWQDAAAGKYNFNLVSIEGKIIEQVYEASNDTLYLDVDGHVFAAPLAHASWRGTPYNVPYLSVGTRVRVSGICFAQGSNHWRRALWFSLHLRTPSDVVVLAKPSWWTTRRMIYLVSALCLAIVVALIWGALLRRRLHSQTLLMQQTLQEEADRERFQTFLEKERSRVLEAINSRAPLEQVLRMVAEFLSEQMNDIRCWIELATGPIVSNTETEPIRPPDRSASGQLRRDILSSNGERLGELTLSWEHESEEPSSSDILDMGVSLAALAIDNRRLYEGLVHRSEYDQLTEIPNRFLLANRLAQALETARRQKQKFALIYIDLDRFKIVNDRFGHRVGDFYLQHVARRLSDKLRAQDTLSRVGGDEFIALIPLVRDRNEADEIARRLNSCFASPFRVDGLILHESASVGVAIYPDDGEDEDQLKRAADNAMYIQKQSARNN